MVVARVAVDLADPGRKPGLEHVVGQRAEAAGDLRETDRPLERLLERNAVFEKKLLELLGDRNPGHPDEAESTRLGEAAAKAISAPFIVLPEYGTRCSTVVTMDDKSRWRLLERRFGTDGEACGESRFSFSSGA